MSPRVGHLEQAMHYFLYLKNITVVNVFLMMCIHILISLVSLSMETGNYFPRNKVSQSLPMHQVQEVIPLYCHVLPM